MSIKSELFEDARAVTTAPLRDFINATTALMRAHRAGVVCRTDMHLAVTHAMKVALMTPQMLVAASLAIERMGDAANKTGLCPAVLLLMAESQQLIEEVPIPGGGEPGSSAPLSA